MLIPRRGRGRNTANIEIVNNTKPFLLKFRISVGRTTYSSSAIPRAETACPNPFISFPRFAYLLSIEINSRYRFDRRENFRNGRRLRIDRARWKILRDRWSLTKLEILLSGKEREKNEYIEIIGTSFEIIRLYRLAKLLINLICTRRNIYIYIYIYGIIRYSKMKLEADNRARFRDNDR